jgi:hypothetical protein
VNHIPSSIVAQDGTTALHLLWRKTAQQHFIYCGARRHNSTSSIVAQDGTTALHLLWRKTAQ